MEFRRVFFRYPGKRYDQDFKITDLLIQFGRAFLDKEKYKSYYITIMNRFTKIINELNLPEQLINEIKDKIERIIESDLEDEDMLNDFKAIGEDSSAKIISAYLQSLGLDEKYINPKDAGIIVKNDSNGAKLLPESFDLIYKLREEKGILIIPGFFG